MYNFLRDDAIRMHIHNNEQYGFSEECIQSDVKIITPL